MVSGLHFNFAFGESNSSNKLEESPKEESIKAKTTSKEEADTILPTKKTIRNTISLKGFIEDPDAIPISIDTESWVDLRVKVPPKHGIEVKKGETIMELDMEKIRTHLNFLLMI